MVLGLGSSFFWDLGLGSSVLGFFVSGPPLGLGVGSSFGVLLVAQAVLAQNAARDREEEHRKKLALARVVRRLRRLIPGLRA